MAGFPPTTPRTSRPDAAAFQRSFPLVALLQLATFGAALGACIDGGKLADATGALAEREFVAWALLAAAAALGACLGFFVGLGQLKMWRSALGGAAVGLVTGLAILAVYVAPAPIPRVASAAAVIIVTTLAIRCRAA
jgi:hypothetical protein